MGTIQKGILGGFSGKVGNVVGGSWKGIDYMRSKGNRRTTTTSQRQKEQQVKFGIIARFQQPLSNLFAISFKSFAVKMTGTNSAMSYNLRNGITGVYPAYAIDYSNILVSRGDMPNAGSPAAAAGAAGIVTFSWLNNAGSGKAKDSDKAIMVVYCEELQQSIFTAAGPDRSAGTAGFDVSAFSGKQVQTWLGFISENEREVATSVFTGAINVV
ncbi:MAG TPA: DUF6266 family protein [Hanamia sp.]|nr:DUF6266 family protein [Hanamia sp.]